MPPIEGAIPPRAGLLSEVLRPEGHHMEQLVGDPVVASSASRHSTVDPRATRERLSVIPLDHQTHLKAKARGENSMSGKARVGETAYPPVRRGPVGMVKARLPESQCPKRNLAYRKNSGKPKSSGDATSRGLKTSPSANPTQRGR